MNLNEEEDTTQRTQTSTDTEKMEDEDFYRNRKINQLKLSFAKHFFSLLLYIGYLKYNFVFNKLEK